IVPVTSEGRFNRAAVASSTEAKITGTAGHNSARERITNSSADDPCATSTPMGRSRNLSRRYLRRTSSCCARWQRASTRSSAYMAMGGGDAAFKIDRKAEEKGTYHTLSLKT